MTVNEFKDFYNKGNKKNDFRNVIDVIIPTVDYTLNYRYDIHTNNKKGVLYYIFNKWVWSWINTINTNYSCICLLINEVNEFIDKEIKISDLENDFQKTLIIIENVLIENKEHFFTPGSNIFEDMFFTTQKTWNDGLSSIVSCLYTLNTNYNIIYELNYERGDKNDMTKGIDFVIKNGDKEKTCQHKRLNKSLLTMDGDYYFFGDFYYTENYRSLDLLSIEKDWYIYIINNSTNKELCRFENGGLIVHKNLVKRMQIEKDNITDLLLEINKICFEKRIIFIYDRDESGENLFEENEIDGKPSIRLLLNDPMDENLEKKLTDQLERLKNRF